MHSKAQHPFNIYLQRLANLSGNNRALFLPRLRSEQFIDLHYLSQLNGETSFSLIKAAIQRKKKMACSLVDSRMNFSNEASKKLKRLQRIDKLIFEERGVKDLHIGWPFVRGKFLTGNTIRCPLLLIAVELLLEKDVWVIKPRDNAHIMFNKFFLLAYSFHNNIRIEESLLEETFEDTDKDSLTFRTTLYKLLEKSTIEIDFNAENYRDELIPFQNFLKKEFEETYEQGRLKLFPEAVLGIFPQSGSYLAPDYMEMMKDKKIKNVETFFLNKNQITKFASTTVQPTVSVEEKKLFAGKTQDVWQENILKAIKTGHSVIAKGPPGTGKSQLICNVICDAIATKKRVLLVCQKRAALDVVYERLKDLQLTNFLALVHDFKSDRKDIYTKAAKQIESIDQYKTEENSLNAIQMERRFIQAGNRIDQIIEELSSLKKALFDDSECGLSIKELYLRSNINHITVDLKHEYQHFPLHTIDDLISKLDTYVYYVQRFEKPDYPWRVRKSFASLSIKDAKEIEKIITSIPSLVQNTCDRLRQETGISANWKQCDLMWENRKQIELMLDHLTNKEVCHYFQWMLKTHNNQIDRPWLTRIEKDMLSCFVDDGPEVSLPVNQIETVRQALSRSIKLQNSLAGLLRWKLFSPDKPLLRKVLFDNALKSNKNGFAKLDQRLVRRSHLEHCLSKLKNISQLTAFPKKYNEVTIKKWFAQQHNAIIATCIFRSVDCFPSLIDLAQTDCNKMKSNVEKAMKILAYVNTLKNQWHTYMHNNQIEALLENPKKCAIANTVLRKDFDTLCEFDALKEKLSIDEQSSIDKIYLKTKTWTNLCEVFTNSLHLAWIDHIETKFPVLRIVSSGKLQLLESELHKLIIEKQKISNEIMLMHAREGITHNLEFNRLHNRITYRDLLHQLTKKRKIWPIRKLLAKFEEEIFRLLPCWMASPESVSTIFPLKEMFDLIIFDEASQCFAERGIPAMYRGSQVLIAGDDKQLRPNDLYRIRWTDNEEDNPDTEVDSLLELAERHLKQLPLRGHYRSKSPELIDFSNQHFYDGNLTCIPYFDHYIRANPPIIYHKVEGQWHDSTNIIEAEEVVRLVIDSIQKNPEKNIGIVTFNSPQQMLIMDLLEDTFSQRQEYVPNSLIVKNIENIQGDEKDIIIFSTGYAPGKTKKLNVQFGSLNIEGGENRLNVAITRAREQIIVVTSIQPHQLHVEETRNKGPKLLKKYLEYAKEVSEGQFVSFIKKEDKKKTTCLLKNKIKSWGEKNFTTCQFKDNILPFTDISAHLNNKEIFLLLTDDEYYYRSPSTRDFHFFIAHTLKQKKWNYIHLYSRNYWQDREAFFNDIACLVAKQKESTTPTD